MAPAVDIVLENIVEIVDDLVVVATPETYAVKNAETILTQYDVNEWGQQVQTSPGHETVYKIMPSTYRNRGLDDKTISDMISISNQTNSQVSSVNVKSGDAKISKDIANTIAEVFKDKVASIMSVSNV